MQITGQTKHNKSFFVTNLALSLASGMPLNIRDPDGPVFPVYKKNRVLYMENEIGDFSLHDRLTKRVVTDEERTVPLYIRTRDLHLKLDTDAGYEALSKEIIATQPDVVILDPLARFHNAEENDEQAMGKILDQMKKWLDAFGISLIFVHHKGIPNADAPRHGSYSGRGSSKIGDSVDTTIEVTRCPGDKKTPILELRFELRNAPDPETHWLLRDESFKLIDLGISKPASVRSAEEMERVNRTYAKFDRSYRR